MPRSNIDLQRLPVIMAEAERIARLLRNKKVDVNEATKAMQFYVYYGMDEGLFHRYLNTMANDPPPRSRRTQDHYRSLNELWHNSGHQLNPEEKRYAWSWGIRLARAGR